jgi:DnaK suppressor protein
MMAEYLQANGQDASGLDQEQRAELRTLLHGARAEALARLQNEVETARSAERLTEPMDAAELAREQGDAALQVERHRDRLRDIDHALAKLDAGTYGVSERSGIPIGFDRLRVIPWARTAAEEEVEVEVEVVATE